MLGKASQLLVTIMFVLTAIGLPIKAPIEYFTIIVALAIIFVSEIELDPEKTNRLFAFFCLLLFVKAFFVSPIARQILSVIYVITVLIMTLKRTIWPTFFFLIATIISCVFTSKNLELLGSLLFILAQKRHSFERHIVAIIAFVCCMFSYPQDINQLLAFTFSSIFALSYDFHKDATLLQ